MPPQAADQVPGLRSELQHDAFTEQAQALLRPNDALVITARAAHATTVRRQVREQTTSHKFLLVD